MNNDFLRHVPNRKGVVPLAGLDEKGNPLVPFELMDEEMPPFAKPFETVPVRKTETNLDFLPLILLPKV